MTINKIPQTYQTRLRLNEKEEEILDAYARLLSSVERNLCADVAKGSSSLSYKNVYLKKYGITARQFNSCRVSLDGKLAASKAGREKAIISLKQCLNSLELQIKKFSKKTSRAFLLHQKQRRYARLSARLNKMQKDFDNGYIPLCFGGKKLFHKQFNLEKNGFSDHNAWKKAWDYQRNNEFFLMGSKDETSGNQTCAASLAEDGTLSIRLRLPKSLEKDFGKYLTFSGIKFTYGQDVILASLQDCANRKSSLNPLQKEMGQAISYRFKKDKKGWRLFATTSLKEKEALSRKEIGVIGIDVNADHIACVETDRYGNPIKKKTLSWVTYGKKKNQAKALTGEICKEIVNWAKEAQKPIVIEDLNFQKKRNELSTSNNKWYARMLSSFSYMLFFACLLARAFKNAILIHKVNPAFTSVIGRVNFAKRYGLTIHMAAALAIARRHQKFSEKPCSSQREIPDGKRGHVAFTLPVRNRVKHVWSFWSQVKRKLTTALAAHFRAIHIRSMSPP